MFRQAAEIRGLEKVASVGRKHVPIERIEHEDDSFHSFTAPVCNFHPLDSQFFVVSTSLKAFVYMVSEYRITLNCEANLENPG
jgi:hypothetical protein